MALWDSLIQVVQREAQHLDQVNLLPDHIVPAPADSASLAGGDGYFQLWVVQMCLKNDRSWFKDWYPVLQSITQLRYGDLATALEIAQVAGPSHLRNIDPDHLNRVVQMDLPLTPLIPFSGGTVQVEAGLFAMMTSDLLKRFLDAMGNFTKLLIVPQISMVLNMANTVSSGVDQLLGISDKRMVLGLNCTFESAGGGGHNELRPLYMVILNAPDGSFPAEKLWIKDSKLLCGASLAEAQELVGVDYMALRIETRRYRDDWESLSTINGPFKKAIEALTKLDANGNPQEADAEAYVRTAAAAALTSPDLAARDRGQIARAIRAQYNDYKAALFGGRGLVAPKAPTLADAALAARSIDSA